MNSLLSRFESINPFSTKPVESYVAEVVKECEGLRVGILKEAVLNFDNPTGMAAAIESSKPKMVVENFATVVPTPTINISNPTIDLGSAPVEQVVAPIQELSDEEQKRANLLAAYDEIDGTAQQNSLSILES